MRASNITPRAKSKLFAGAIADFSARGATGPGTHGMSERTYLDWNATAPLRPEARGAMMGALDLAGNASSVHAEGRAARRLIEAARAQVAALVGAEAKNITFTSGATEANMLALTPSLEVGGRKEPRDRLFVSAIEHPSVRSGGRFAPLPALPAPLDATSSVGTIAF